jgi:hypothetical protein
VSTKIYTSRLSPQHSQREYLGASQVACQRSRPGMLGRMPAPEGRAPRPKRGDPNVKMVRLALSSEEWRKLRVWAAEADTSMQQIVGEIVRRELAPKPRRGY